MRFSLDQLLDETGVSDLAGTRFTKAADARGPDLAKLAQLCRQAADATPAERDAAKDQDLAEKTAAIAVISRTLAEINSLDSVAPPEQTKTAAAGPDAALFIKTALEQGHSPESIAAFLEKEGGLFGRLLRRGETWRAAKGTARAERDIAHANETIGRSFRKWQDIVRRAESAPEAERAALIAQMRKSLGDEKTMKVFSAHQGGGYKNLEAFKDLKRSVPTPAPAPGAPGGPAHRVGVNIGGTQMGLTSEQLQKMKTPALYLGGGYLAHKAISGGGGNENKKRGVVVVNS